MSKKISILVCMISVTIFSIGAPMPLFAQLQINEKDKGMVSRRLGKGSFGLGGRDYRISLQWIAESSAQGKKYIYGSGDFGRKIQFAGRTRFHEIHVPSGYKPSQPTAAVLVFHGGGGYPGAVRYSSGMDRVADHEGFIVVYPAGTPQSIYTDRLLVWNAGGCCGRAVKNNVDDVGFVNAVLDDVEKYFSIDSKRIYATGISNGAQMTYRIGIELSDRIAAIAPVAAPMAIKKSPTRPLSIMHFHGLADQDVPYEGGVGIGVTGFNHISIPENMQFWINFYQCPPSPSATERKGKAVMTRYGPCLNNTEVVLWVLEDGGHTWPGSGSAAFEGRSAEVGIGRGKVNQDISASEVMWEFFKRHPMK